MASECAETTRREEKECRDRAIHTGIRIQNTPEGRNTVAMRQRTTLVDREECFSYSGVSGRETRLPRTCNSKREEALAVILEGEKE